MAKILLAEDDQSMMHFLIVALERAGHSIEACEDGLQAIEALDKNTGYDLLLTDIVMPGMDGIELAQKAQVIQPDIKVMFITGFAAMAIKADDKDNAPDASQVLSKPFHLNDLVQQVEDLLAA